MDAFCNCADGFETKRIDMGYTAIEDDDALAVLRLADTTGLIKRIEEYKTRITVVLQVSSRTTNR